MITYEHKPLTGEEEAMLVDFVLSPFYNTFKRYIDVRSCELTQECISKRDLSKVDRIEELENIMNGLKLIASKRSK